MRLANLRTLLCVVAVATVSMGLSCGGTEPDPPPPSQLTIKTTPSQTAANRAAFATQPAIQISDSTGAAVAQSGTVVSVAITSGGGTLGGTTTATSDANGTATFTNLSISGTAGAHTLTFSSGSLKPASVQVTTTAGAAATIAVDANNNQSATVGTTLSTPPSVKVTDPDANAVAGVTVTFAITGGGGSGTGLTQTTDASGIAKPSSWTLGSAAGANTMTATAAGLTGSPVTLTATGTATPVSNATCTTRALGLGQAVAVSAAGEQGCNTVQTSEASPSGSAHYYVAVSNVGTTYSTTGAAFQLKGSVATAAGPTARVSERLDRDPSRARVLRPLSTEELAEQAHYRILEQNIKYLREHRSELIAKKRTGATLAAISSTPTVGAQVTLNLPNVTPTNSNICTNPFPITGRIVYVGTKAVIVEETSNVGAGTLDTMWTRIGGEFDNVMFPILANFGNPLAKDATTDNNGRIVMVFSQTFNDKYVGSGKQGLAGFVVSCDFAATTATNNTQTNTGEYFYAQAPTTTSGTLNTDMSPARWNWLVRPTIIHEVKHIVSFAERLSRSASTFEESWLEESTARLSEELYERAVYSFSQKSNIGYGSSSNPVGPYCGVRGCGTPAKARGFIRVWDELGPKWYASPELYSPIGRIDASDFSFYATGWSLVRWSIDQGSMTESAFLQALVQETSLSGAANLAAKAGRNWTDMIQEWSMAMVVDDYPGLTLSGAPATRMSQPSWNFRGVFSGYKADFGTQLSFAAWPLVPYARTLGAFTVDVPTLRPGTSAIIELTGTASTKQKLELLGSGGVGTAPSELRISVIRVP